MLTLGIRLHHLSRSEVDSALHSPISLTGNAVVQNEIDDANELFYLVISLFRVLFASLPHSISVLQANLINSIACFSAVTNKHDTRGGKFAINSYKEQKKRREKKKKRTQSNSKASKKKCV